MVTLSSAMVLPHKADNDRDISHEGDFKHTDLAPLPTDWELVPLGDICQFQNGVNADAKAYGKGIPFANVLEVINNTFLDASRIPGRVEVPKATVTAFRVLRGDILFNRTSETLEEVGLTAVYLDDTPVVFGGFVVRGRPKPGTFDSTYLGYALRSQLVRMQIASKGQGAVRANISQAELRNVRVPRPPDDEQQAIARVLRDADDLVESLERLLEKKRFIKQGALHDLLSGRRRLPGFSGEWKAVPMGSLFSFKNGLNKAKRYFGRGTPIINYMDVFSQSGLRALDVKGLVDVSKNEIENFSARKGDVFFTRTSETLDEIGVSSVLLEDIGCAVFSGFVLRARPRGDDLDDGFKRYCFASKSVRHQIVSKGTYTTRALTNGRVLSTVLLILPPTKAEQHAIAEVLTEMDAELESLEAKFAKASQIKQGMMQELLTGRVRLV